MNKVIQFFKDSYTEMTEHVTWLSYPEVQGSSLLVLAATAIFVAVIGVIDLSFNEALKAIYTMKF